MGTLLAYLRPFIAPVVAPWIAALVVYIQTKYNIVYTPDVVEKLNEAAVIAVVSIFGLCASVAGFIKVMFNKWLNKSNAATTEMVEHGNKVGKNLRRSK